MSHPQKAAEFLKDSAKSKWHDDTLWFIRDKRDKMSHTVPEWEELRDLASSIKDNVLGNLADYLEEFERNATKNGIKVHWAADAQEHNEIVLSILKEKECKAIVKSKSILTEECHLNPFWRKMRLKWSIPIWVSGLFSFSVSRPAILYCRQFI